MKNKVKEKIGDIFNEVMQRCRINHNTLVIREDLKDDSQFKISVKSPYREVILTICKKGRKTASDGNWDDIKMYLYHEAFHVLVWNYTRLAESRYTGEEQLKNCEEETADKFSYIMRDCEKEISKLKKQKRKRRLK
jgi:hypothetical protein